MNRGVRWAASAILLLGTAATGAGQKTGDQQTQPGGYTLHEETREVVTDVVVTDHKGNPVHGLAESAFHIFDNGKQQQLASFVEHAQADANTPWQKSAANPFNNDIVLHPPRVFNVILLDTATIGLSNQMNLRQQLERFIAKLPADQPFAVLARSSEHVIMLANFTSDHQQLLAAIRKELPRIPVPGSQYVADASLLGEICAYLEQYPGRKNVLWFNAGSALLLNPDPEVQAEVSANARALYDALELARIALYPIDVRGLQVAPPLGTTSQDLLMEDEADATGGQAVFNNNGIADAARHIADTDASFYTLTYSPKDVKLDNKWHKIKVEVEGADYQLSYRRGYFDDGSNLKRKEDTTGRKRLLQSGDTAPELHQTPIVFQVSVNPLDKSVATSMQNVSRASTEPLKRGERAYELRYGVPMNDLPMQAVDNEEKFTVGVAVLAFDQYGNSIFRVSKNLTLGISQERVKAAPAGANLSFDQIINLPRGEDFLYVVVWNPETRRLGTVQIPLAVEKSHAH